MNPTALSQISFVQAEYEKKKSEPAVKCFWRGWNK